MLEKENSKFEIVDDKNPLDELFQEKLKKSLKVCATLDENYPVALKENNLEDELKKTLHIYSSLPVEERHLEFERELKGLFDHKLETTKKKSGIIEKKPILSKQEMKFSQVLETPKVKTYPINQTNQISKKENHFSQKLERPKVKPLSINQSSKFDRQERVKPVPKLDEQERVKPVPKLDKHEQVKSAPKLDKHEQVKVLTRNEIKPKVKVEISEVKEDLRTPIKPFNRDTTQVKEIKKIPIEKEKIKAPKPKERLKPEKTPTEKDFKEVEIPLKSGIGTSDTFFSEDIMQKIRYLFYRAKSIEESMQKSDSKIDTSDLQILHEYVNFLNVNYKTQSQVKILRELDIYPKFYDPIEMQEIKIWDLILECGRVFCILGEAYSRVSDFYEKNNDFDSAISYMVSCSKAFKTAAYFSAAHTRQEVIGTFLSAENLEIKSEEARIMAQNLAIKKDRDDLFLTSKMYSGLAALLNRLHFIKNYTPIEGSQVRALISYYKGKSCHLKAKGILSSSNSTDIYDDTNVIDLQKKANYYFIVSEEIWEKLLTKRNELSEDQIQKIKNHLANVNQEIMENDVEIIDSIFAEKIQDPEPFIAIPENLSFCMPKFTKFLTNYPNTVLEKRSLDFVNSEQASKHDDLNVLRNQKAGIGRTIKQIRVLYESGDIDVNKFTELFEKYSTKFIEIEEKISSTTSLSNQD